MWAICARRRAQRSTRVRRARRSTGAGFQRYDTACLPPPGSLLGLPPAEVWKGIDHQVGGRRRRRV